MSVNARSTDPLAPSQESGSSTEVTPVAADQAATKYRPEIDGLRTIAVLSVIIYHAEFIAGGRFLLPGGFIGVDVFFVISGYLITGLIVNELHRTGRFSVLRFYERRARRLLPALLLVMLASIIAAWKILLPAQLVDFSHSLLASLFFVSNFYWDSSLQVYGAQPALLKPFLHTWSLAVEEQYYIVFPLLLLAVFTWIRARLILVIALGLVASLWFAQWYTELNPNSSFYMLPSRFWELLAGGLLSAIAYKGVNLSSTNAVNTLASVIGLGAVLSAFLLFNHDTPHPGLVTVLPVAGTMLIIAFSGAGNPVTRVLASRGFVGIGLISYSLYLWHFPIFAFARNMHPDLGPGTKLFCIALTFVLSYLSYFVVERPFRDRRRMPIRTALLLLSAASLLVVGFCIYAIQAEGVRDRFARMQLLYGQNEFDNAVLKKKSWSVLNNLAAAQGLGPSDPLEPSEFEATRLWFSDDAATRKVLIVGVSISCDLFNALYLNRDEFPGTEFARIAMHRSIKPEHVATLLQSPNYNAADTIIVDITMSNSNQQEYRELVEKLVASGKRILLVSNPIIFASRDGKELFDWNLLENGHNAVAGADLLGLFYHNIAVPPEQQSIIENMANALGLKFLDLRTLVCDFSAQQCTGVTPEGYKAYYDGVHWTLEGARYFGKRIAEQGWLDPQ